MRYSKEDEEKVFNIICERIEKGESLRSVLKDKEMPSSRTFFKWIDSSEDKVKQYARATELRAEDIFDEMFYIADNTIEGIVIETDDNGRTKEKKGDMLGHRRLQIDTRKWALSKMNPKKYGDKTVVDNTSSDGTMSTKQINLTIDGKDINLGT